MFPTYARAVLCLAGAPLTLNFSPSMRAARTYEPCGMRQPLQVAPSNKWSWVRADNTGHVDLVNLARGILQEPLRNTRASRMSWASPRSGCSPAARVLAAASFYRANETACIVRRGARLNSIESTGKSRDHTMYRDGGGE